MVLSTFFGKKDTKYKLYKQEQFEYKKQHCKLIQPNHIQLVASAKYIEVKSQLSLTLLTLSVCLFLVRSAKSSLFFLTNLHAI